MPGVQARIKDGVKAGNAVRGATNWTVNGSARDGAKMVREFSKLMLRAYNNEADNAVRLMKPYTLESSVARLQKARDTIIRPSRRHRGDRARAGPARRLSPRSR